MARLWDFARWRSVFIAIWTGRAFSLFGSQLVQFALVWWLTQTTGSATVLAGATLVALLPQILVAPIAGALVDRWNRRWVMVFADGGIALATLGLALLFAFGIARVWHVYLALLVRSMGGAFHWPAMQAATAMMVPDRHLARIGGLNQSLFGLASIVCPRSALFSWRSSPSMAFSRSTSRRPSWRSLPSSFSSFRRYGGIRRPKGDRPSSRTCERVFDSSSGGGRFLRSSLPRRPSTCSRVRRFRSCRSSSRAT